MSFDHLIALVSNLPFAIAICVYLLTRFDRLLSELARRSYDQAELLKQIKETLERRNWLTHP